MRKLIPVLSMAALGFAALSSLAQDLKSVALSDLDLGLMRQGWGEPRKNEAVTGKPLSIGGIAYTNGVGTHARSVLWLELDGQVRRLMAAVGVDDATTSDSASIEFQIGADGRRIWRSGVMRRGDTPKPVDVDLAGVRQLLLLVTDAGDGVNYDHADWAEARFAYGGTLPKPARAPSEPREILTPRPGPEPQINGPSVYGCRPGSPFLYRIPTTGERPLRFEAEGLPATLALDNAKGLIQGTTPARGNIKVNLRATNEHGSAKQVLEIRSGDGLALTPPMGWNHWYAHYDRVTDTMIRRAADILAESGMADVGYTYVSIDDCWMNAPKHRDPLRVGPLRDEDGNIVPNRHFPDMRALTDHIHRYGLKAGIYISPGPFTCAGFAGSYGHEAQDARRFASWGFDLLKYDWCSYGRVPGVDQRLDSLKKPYRLMSGLLRQQSRDIILNLCQYGMGDVWEWGAEVGGHSWRTSGDLGFELSRIFEVALANAEHRRFNGPGSWNDPDYIQIGYIGSARGMGRPQPCPLSPNEQYAFMSLWCLMAAPLFYSGDLEKLDAFTLNVLCNREVIEVNQDSLGHCARPILLTDEVFLMVKPMADGSIALGIFNSGEFTEDVFVPWSKLQIEGARRVRDLWRHMDLGIFHGGFRVAVPRRGGWMTRLFETE